MSLQTAYEYSTDADFMDAIAEGERYQRAVEREREELSRRTVAELESRLHGALGFRLDDLLLDIASALVDRRIRHGETL